MSINEEGQPENFTDDAALNLDVNTDLPPISDLLARSYAPIRAREFRLLSSPRRKLKRELEKTIGQAPEDMRGVLLSLIADCDLRAYDAQRSSKWWSRAYYMLGLPAAVLATIAGAAALVSSTGRIAVAIVALASAGLTTAATFLNSNENKQSNSKFSAAWQELADEVRLTLIQYGQEMSESKDDRSLRKAAVNSLIRSGVHFNKRKSALLRGDLTPIPREIVSASLTEQVTRKRWSFRRTGL
jgi:hypothetical protein